MNDRLAGNNFKAAADPIMRIPEREIRLQDNLRSRFQAVRAQAMKLHIKNMINLNAEHKRKIRQIFVFCKEHLRMMFRLVQKACDPDRREG